MSLNIQQIILLGEIKSVANLGIEWAKATQFHAFKEWFEDVIKLTKELELANDGDNGRTLPPVQE